MDIKQVSSNSLSFIGDAVYTLRVREYCLNKKVQRPKDLQKMCNQYNSASGQTKAFNYLLEVSFFNKEDLDIFKRGRNAIRHIPKNGNRATYEIASGLEAITGFMYLTNDPRLDAMFEKIFEGGENE